MKNTIGFLRWNYGRLARWGGLIGLIFAVVIQPAQGQVRPIDTVKLGPEHFFLTLDPNKASVLVDLMPFKAIVSAVPQAERAAFASAMSRKVSALVIRELETSDVKALKEIMVNYVYVTQRDEYSKPRAGGLQKIGTIRVILKNGVVVDVQSSGSYLF